MTEHEQHLFETIHWSTVEDLILFNAFTDGLPKRSADTPYHSGPHSVDRFRMMLKLAQPKRVLEIGFNLGHSAAIMLELGVGQVMSMQPTIGEKTATAIKVLERRFGPRFAFVQIDSFGKFDPIQSDFDLAFIDGDHGYGWVDCDIKFCRSLGITNFFMDDYDSHHGPGVIRAVRENRLVVKAIFGTMAWCVNRDGLALRHNPEEHE